MSGRRVERSNGAPAVPSRETFNPGFPVPDPVGVPGCAVCDAHLRTIAHSRREHQLTALSDSRVLMARHLDEGHH